MILDKEARDLVDSITIFGKNVETLKHKQFRFSIIMFCGFGFVLVLILVIISYILFSIVPHIDSNTKHVKQTQCNLYRSVLRNGYHPEDSIDKTESIKDQQNTLDNYNFLYNRFIYDNNNLGCLHIEEPKKYITDPTKITTTTTFPTPPT